MKQIILLCFFAFILITSCACDKDARTSADFVNNSKDTIRGKMKIKVGTSTFSATIYNNTTAAAFKKLLPLAVDMTDLNGNEKYADLSETLPTNPFNPGTIQNGDLMLYDSSTLVLFYKTFNTSYNYTIVGRIDDTTGLAAALGQGNIKVTFE